MRYINGWVESLVLHRKVEGFFHSIGTRPVDAGLSNLGRVKGTVTEDNVPREGIIYYDIRFTAYLKEKEMKILINKERRE